MTSLPLVKALQDRSNRLKGCILKSEKEINKEGLGSVNFKVEASCYIIALRWFDNESVDVVSSYVGLNSVGEVLRWDKQCIIVKRLIEA